MSNVEKSSQQLPFVEGVSVPSREEIREKVEREYVDHKTKVTVPHQLIEERFEYQDVQVEQPVYYRNPKIKTLHRKIAIQTPVHRVEVEEVPQLHVVDKIVEEFEDLERHRKIKDEQIVLQERVIPIKKRKIKEITKKVDRETYNRLIEEAQLHKRVDSKFDEQAAPGGPYEIRKRVSEFNAPKYRHYPKPIEIPIVHYKPKIVERLVNRCVPVPIELNLVQEFKCPTLVPQWVEQPKHVSVKRKIEKPVPVDAFANKMLMKMYLEQTKDLDREAEARWMRNAGPLSISRRSVVIDKMSPEEIKAYGLAEFNIDDLASVDSAYDWASLKGINLSTERLVVSKKAHDDFHKPAAVSELAAS